MIVTKFKDEAVYIKLIEGEHQCRTLQLNDDIALNIGKGEKLIGIEILDAKDEINFDNLQIDSLPFKHLIFNQVSVF